MYTNNKPNTMKTRTHALLTGILGLLVTAALCSTSVAQSTVSTQMQETRAHFQTLLAAKPGFYPACTAGPVRPRQENFQKKHLTLSGLTGVHLDIDGLIKSAGRKNTKLINDLKQQVIKRLAQGNLKLLTAEEMAATPGQPEMNIYMSFPPHLTPVKKGGKPAAYRPDCCTMSTWAAFSQAAKIMRDPDTHYKLGTWGEGHNTRDCSDPAAWMSQVVLKTVDSFVRDKLKGDQDYAAWLKQNRNQPKPTVANKQTLQQQVAQELAALQTAQTQAVAAVQTQLQTAIQPAPYQLPTSLNPQLAAPANCNGAVRTYIDLFTTNQAHIDAANYYILDLLAADIRACPMYRYSIETHADLRSSSAYNEKLSALRAASIQRHLLARGVHKSQFIIQSFGELNPVTQGTTPLDHAANRRVVVRPYTAQMPR